MKTGQRGVTIARFLWPHLKLVEQGGDEDRRGTDGYGFGLFGEEKVQIKFDARIAQSGNVYHEIWEKTKGRPDQGWRPSPHDARWFIFVTEGNAWLISTDTLARVEIGLRLTKISETSAGFLIPLSVLEGQCQSKPNTLHIA